MAVYYHVTAKDAAERILASRRILAKGGIHVARTNDQEGAYFCDWDSVPYWQLLLGRDTVLAVQVPDSVPMDRWPYQGYREWVSYGTVAFHAARDVSPHISRQAYVSANHALCLSYLWMWNRICLGWARYYHGECGRPEGLADETRTGLDIMGRLRYRDVAEGCLESEMAKIADSCCYAFTDRYKNTDLRMWEQLARYPKDGYAGLRETFCARIQELPVSVNKYPTGGWMPERRTI